MSGIKGLTKNAIFVAAAAIMGGTALASGDVPKDLDQRPLSQIPDKNISKTHCQAGIYQLTMNTREDVLHEPPKVIYREQHGKWLRPCR